MNKFKEYENARLINNWEELLKKNKEYIVSLEEEWERIYEENKELARENREKVQEEIEKIVKTLNESGVDVHKYKRVGFIKEVSGFKAWFKNNVVHELEKKYPTDYPSIPRAFMDEKEVNGVLLYNNVSPVSLVELYDRISRQYKEELRKQKKNSELFIKSMEYAIKNKMDIEGMDEEDIVKTVHERAKEDFISNELSEGTEIYLNHECDFCTKYIMGEGRCSCGNRRIGISVEGNIVEGFIYYTEAY